MADHNREKLSLSASKPTLFNSFCLVLYIDMLIIRGILLDPWVLQKHPFTRECLSWRGNGIMYYLSKISRNLIIKLTSTIVNRLSTIFLGSLFNHLLPHPLPPFPWLRRSLNATLSSDGFEEPLSLPSSPWASSQATKHTNLVPRYTLPSSFSFTAAQWGFWEAM